jgi:hypothetical protein
MTGVDIQGQAFANMVFSIHSDEENFFLVCGDCLKGVPKRYLSC